GGLGPLTRARAERRPVSTSRSARLTILGAAPFRPPRASRQKRYSVTFISSMEPICGSTSSKNPSGTRTVFCLSVENPVKGLSIVVSGQWSVVGGQLLLPVEQPGHATSH